MTKESELQEQIEGLEEILFKPSSYREAYRSNTEDGDEPEIFEVLRSEIVEYAMSNLNFKDYLLTRLSPKATSKSPSTSIRSPAIFSPRVLSTHIRGSSRPTLS